MVNWKSNIIKILSISIWSGIGIGALALLISAMNKKNEQLCKGFNIEIKGSEVQLFIDKDDIQEKLLPYLSNITQLKVSEVDPKKMESLLRVNPWIRNAEIFLDNNNIVRIQIKESKPVARIFTTSGNSFYIDSGGLVLPLSDKMSVRLPVFTDFPSARIKFFGADSILIRHIIRISEMIEGSSFWTAQVAQINITPGRTFELVPLIGNNIIYIGNADNLENKFNRLFIFYRQVLSRNGFNCYEKIDVQYDKQIVATRKPVSMLVKDSLLAIRKVKDLISGARSMQPDTMLQKNIRPLEKLSVSEQSLTNYDLLPENGDTIKKQNKNKQLKTNN